MDAGISPAAMRQNRQAMRRLSLHEGDSGNAGEVLDDLHNRKAGRACDLQQGLLVAAEFKQHRWRGAPWRGAAKNHPDDVEAVAPREQGGMRFEIHDVL